MPAQPTGRPPPKDRRWAYSCRTDSPPECPFRPLLGPGAAWSCRPSWAPGLGVLPPNTCLFHTDRLTQTDADFRTHKCTHSHTGPLTQTHTLRGKHTQMALPHSWAHSHIDTLPETHAHAHAHTHDLLRGHAACLLEGIRAPCRAERQQAEPGGCTCHGRGFPAGKTALSRAQPPLLSGAVQFWTWCEGTFHFPILEENQGHRL